MRDRKEPRDFRSIGTLLSETVRSPSSEDLTMRESTKPRTLSETTGLPRVGPVPPSEIGPLPGETGSAASPSSEPLPDGLRSLVTLPPVRSCIAALLNDRLPYRWQENDLPEWWRRNLANWTTARPMLAVAAECLDATLEKIEKADAERHLSDLAVMFPGRAEDETTWDDRYRLYLKYCGDHSVGAWQHAVDDLARTRKSFYPSPAELLEPMEAWTGRVRYQVDLLHRLASLEPPQDAGEDATLDDWLALRQRLGFDHEATSQPRSEVRAMRKGLPPLEGAAP